MLNILFQALRVATDQLSAGFIICGADARIFHANCAATEMMEQGWPIRRYNQNFLRVSDRGRHEHLLSGLRQIAGDASIINADQPSLEIPLASVRSVRGAAIATLRPLLIQDQPLMSLFITVAARNCGVEVSGFSACFGLTPAETRTLQQVMKGRSAIEAASSLKVSHNTVKTHLRNIFAKTRTSRQPDLVNLFLGLTPPLRGPRQAAADKSGPRGLVHGPKSSSIDAHAAPATLDRRTKRALTLRDGLDFS